MYLANVKCTVMYGIDASLYIYAYGIEASLYIYIFVYLAIGPVGIDQMLYSNMVSEPRFLDPSFPTSVVVSTLPLASAGESSSHQVLSFSISPFFHILNLPKCPVAFVPPALGP